MSRVARVWEGSPVLPAAAGCERGQGVGYLPWRGGAPAALLVDTADLMQ